MVACPYPVADLLPHAGRMVLLDHVLDATETVIEAELSVGPDNPFFEPGRGIAAHIAIEWMAQACGAFVGLEAKRAGVPVRIGFLLGTRRYSACTPWFASGQTLRVSARCELIGDNGLGQFACHIHDAAGMLLGAAMVSVFEPPAAAAPQH